MHCSGCDNMPFWRWLKETQMYPTSITCNDFDGEFQTNFQPYSVIGCSGEYLCTLGFENLLSLPNKLWETYCFCSVSYYYYSYSPFFPCTMNFSTADLRNYRTEFHETWWSYRYMFLVDSKVFRFVVKGVKAIFLGVQRGWGLL